MRFPLTIFGLSKLSGLLKVFNDILLAIDGGKNAILILFYLTATFDAVDHNVLIWLLEHLFSIKGTALWWFNLHLKDKSFALNQCFGVCIKLTNSRDFSKRDFVTS